MLCFLTCFVLVKWLKTASSSSEKKLSLFFGSWFNGLLSDRDVRFLNFCTSCWNIFLFSKSPMYFLGSPCPKTSYCIANIMNCITAFMSVSSKNWRPGILSSSKIIDWDFANIALRLKKNVIQRNLTSVNWEQVWRHWYFVIHSLHSHCLV